MSDTEPQTSREYLEEILPKVAHKKIDEILAWFGSTDVEWFDTVEVDLSRAAISAIELHGLTIGLDACDNAVSVSSPWGFTVVQ